MGETALRTIVTMNGRTLTFMGDEGDAYFQGLEAFHNGSPQFENFIRANLRPDSRCVDVGANIGLTTALLAAYCPAGRVYAIEASPRNACYLRRNLEANDLRNCVVLETAVGDRCGSVSFLESSFGAGSHVLSGESARSSAARTIPLATLDSLFSASDGPIDFMKMDVEGFEPLAICGAARLIERDRCAIFMEFNSWCLQVLHEFNPFAFARSLTSAFDVTVIGKGGEEIPVGHADVHGFMYRNIMQNGCVDDVVLRLRKGARVPRLARMVKGADDLRIWREAQRLRRELREERDRRYFGLGKWMSARAPANGDARQTDHTASPFENAGPAHRPAIVVQQRRPAAETAEPGKNMHLQLLRALAICFVLGAHLSITSSLLMHLPFAASNPGWIGVELFFVVSGYVVTLSMASARFSVASFVIRRVFRLYPLLLLFLLVLLAAKLATDALAPGAPPLFSPSLEAMYHQALAMLLAYHPTSEWGLTFNNRAAWSLSVELRFYASLAIFVGLLNLLSEDRGAHRRNILSAAAIVYLTGAGARILTCFGITFELGELLIGKMYDFIALGTVAALLPSSWTERIARHTRAAIWLLVFAPLMLVMVVGSPGSPGSHPAFFNLAMLAVGLMFAMVVVICTSQQSAPHLSRRVRTLGNFLGDRSYAIFLLHLPVLNVAWALGQRFGQDGGYWQWPLFQLAIALVLLPPLVELAHRYIELPMIDAGRSLARRLRGLQGQVADPIWARPARRQPDLPWERAA